ncbi:ABC transporter [Planotetraspora phitsanulokensis]|uniref:ABC transporter n=1 Tax=Planotetraspora phitsanulokensis TaxID=575192 RepID=A0A8J3XH96_9ACTN|nr:hypothetical protein [Planotetraspora phitsanulokensis]GII36333.1 ABC transporter [Planotetraspora phitsanulokensis]
MNLSLVRFEARRLLRHPILWGATLAALALSFAWDGPWLPDMTMVTIDTVTASTLIGAAVLVIANLATGRDRRHDLPETLAALPTRAAPRTRAIVLAAPFAGGLAAAVMISAHLLVVSSSDTAAGRFDPYEALGGVGLVALAASAGAALARWTPSLILPPVLIVAVAFDMVGNPWAEYGGWLLPVIPGHSPDWGPRPSAPHLLYLVAAAVLLGAAALLRHGPRFTRVAVAVVATAVTAAAGSVTTAGAPVIPWRGTASPPHPPRQVCEDSAGVTFCAYPDYTPWIPVWSEAIRPLVTAVPARALDRLPPIRQRSFNSYLPSGAGDGKPATWTTWSTDPAQHRALLVGQVAARLAGLGEGCDGRGLARTVVALWLTGRAGPLLDAPDPALWQRGPGNGLTNGLIEVPMGDNAGGLSVPGQLGGLRYGSAEVGYARRLLERDDAAGLITENWDVLTAPGTTVEQALPLLGLGQQISGPRREAECA